MKRFALSLTLVSISSLPVVAQEPPRGPSASVSNDARMQSLEDQVRTLVEEVSLLRAEVATLRSGKGPASGGDGKVGLASSRIEPGVLPSAPEPAVRAPASQPDPTPAPPAQVAQTQTYGGATANAKLLNPDISMIGDFIGTAGHNTVAPGKALELHESEVGMQAIIDPYARADVFLSFGEQGVNVEEGYITFTSLPAGLLARVGKMRAAFGRVNTLH